MKQTVIDNIVRLVENIYSGVYSGVYDTKEQVYIIENNMENTILAIDTKNVHFVDELRPLSEMSIQNLCYIHYMLNL